jgi:hypothetical protein
VTKNRVRWIWLFLAFVAIFGVVQLVESRAASFQDSSRLVHMSVDWSNRHVIYSGETAGPNAWKAMRDPRYHRHLSIFGKDKARAENREGREDHDKWHDRRGRGPISKRELSPLQRDWQFDLGPNSLTTNGQNFFIYPAKFSFDINAAPSCTDDFVTFPTGLPGVTGGQASIVATNELYSGSGAGGSGICGTGQPSVMWAYNINLPGDTTGQVLSSPVLSIDGSKVAFIENNAGDSGVAVLKILKWVPGEGSVSDAAAPTAIDTGNDWSTCPATGTSCLFSLTFSDSTPDSISSPFYDYANDTIYVGDDSGVLHKFTGVFNGTPAEVMSEGWPIALSQSNVLTGPVFDAVSGNIFVADTAATLFYVRDTSSTVGACASGSPPCEGTPSLTVADPEFGRGVFDAPTLDQTSQMVFVFTGFDPTDSAAVIQATTALANPVDTVLQGGYNPIFSGAFDQNYNSGNYASGFLYACGTNPLGLYRIGFNSSGVMNSFTDEGNLSVQQIDTGGPLCSPVTEILNGANDYLFFGVDALGSPPGCSGGCVLSLNLTGMAWPPDIGALSSLTVPNGPSGIIVDNVGTDGQESSIYFGPQTNNCTSPSGSGCAVKATQSGLN